MTFARILQNWLPRLLRLTVVAMLSGFIFDAMAQPGTAFWTNRYTEVGGDNVAKAVVADSSGNIFVAGYTGYSSQHQFTVLKYAPSGMAIWTNNYHGPALHPDDKVTALALDGDGNVIVSGYSLSGADSYDFATIKYSSGGQPLWTNRYDGPGKYDDRPVSVAIDRSNNVIVAGYSPRSSYFPYNDDFATIKYSNAGVPLWTNRYNGPANGEDKITALAVDTNGDVYVTGGIDGGIGGNFGIIKYSSAGIPLWTNLSANMNPVSLAVGTNGSDVYLAGMFYNGSNYDFATLNYSTTGAALWTNYYDGALGNDYPAALVVRTSGDVIVAGYSYSSSSNYDFATVAYTGTGSPLWTNRYDSGLDDIADQAAADSAGNIFVTGYSYNAGGSTDLATVGYASNGTPLWTAVYNGPGDGVDIANAVAVDPYGNVMVTGNSDGGGFSYDFVTIKYSPAKSPMPPLLNFEVSANQFILSWTNPIFVLQVSDEASTGFTNVPGTMSPHTNSLADAQKFFRLKQD